MTILVTGATGHVGRQLVEALLKRGEKVRIMDIDRGVGLIGVEIVTGDMRDRDEVKRAMDGVEAVYHLAAVVDDKPSPRKLMYDVNVNGTKNLLEFSSGKKVIYLSSAAVYGVPMRENPASEGTPTRPTNFYGKTKAIAEKLVLEKGGVVLRAPVIFGPGFNEGFDFVTARIEKGKMQLIGDGNNRIQWLHVKDLIAALLLAKDAGKPGEVYLIAGGEAKTQAELFSLLAKYLNVAPPNKKASKLLVAFMANYMALRAKLSGKAPKLLPEYINRITDNRQFDISKARSELGFKPEMSYELAAKEIVSEYLTKKSSKTDSAK